MEQAVPLIYTKDELPPLPGFWVRASAAAIATGALAILLFGAYLAPPTQGYSTHTQLGLAPCQFEIRTNLPCPSCGFTTSVTHFVHGNWLASLYLQPMGFVIAIGCCTTVWIGYYIALTGRPVYRLLNFIPGRYWVMVLLSIALGGWGWKIFIHLAQRDHWPP